MGDIRKKPEIEKCDMGGSVEEKQSYLSRKPFLLLKYYRAFIEFNMFMVGATLTACVSVDLADPLIIFVHIFMQNVTCPVYLPLV